MSSVWRFLPSLQVDYKFHFLPDLRWNVNLAYDYAKGEGVSRTSADYAIIMQIKVAIMSIKTKIKVNY
jgi:iron complex outermembrane receptor protein